MDLVVHICLDDLYDTSAPPSVKKFPLVNFVFLMSDIQSTSLYLSNITR
jgi:hypothetical protein